MRIPSSKRLFRVQKVRVLAPLLLTMMGSPGWFSAISQAQNQPASNQSTSGQPPSAQSQKPAPPAPRKSTAEDNPFPADVSEKAAEQRQKEQQPAPPDAPSVAAPGAPPQPGASATDNAFPEDVSRRAAAEKSAADAADANGTGVSSSNAGSASPDSGNPDPAGDIPRDNGRRKLRKPSRDDIQSGSLAGEGTAKDDTRIGAFYLGDHNYQGAYNRFAEAVRLDPGNVEAIYGLAESAANLHRTEEAVNNYKLYLAVAPDGGHAKSVQKALRELVK